MPHTPSANRCSMRAPISCLWSNPSRIARYSSFTRALYPEHRLDPGAEQENTSLRRALLSLDDRSADSEHGRCRTRHMGGKDRAVTPKAGHLQADLLHDALHQPDGNEVQCTGGCSLWAGSMEDRERVLQLHRTTRTELQTQLRAWQNRLANLLATLNLLAFALHTTLDQIRGLWSRGHPRTLG